jgi:L-lactate dehydrogenase
VTTAPGRCSCGRPSVLAACRWRRFLRKRGETLKDVRAKLEQEVRYANITIIEGHNASQYGIGIVSARITEMVLRDEHAVVAVGSLQKNFGVTLSLPSVVGRGGVIEVLQTELSEEERGVLEKSAENLVLALEGVERSTQPLSVSAIA